MLAYSYFLDTNALVYLAGLKDSELQIFKNRIEAGNSELSTTHIQIDEITKHIKFHEPVKGLHEKKVQSYQQKIDEALKTLKNKGIVVHIEPTKAFVLGVSRLGHGALGSEDIGKIYDELRKVIEECERAKGKIKTLLNIACDAVIAVSSIDHDFFITTDRCLSDSWYKIIDKHKTLNKQFKIPKIVYARRSPKDVANRILVSIVASQQC